MKLKHLLVKGTMVAGLLLPVINLQERAIAGDLTSEFNVITFGDFSSSSDIEGRAFIGGNLTQFNSTTFGGQLNASFDNGPLTGATDDVLVVGGNLVAQNGINVQLGRVRVGGTAIGNINLNGRNQGATLITGDSSIAAQTQAFRQNFQQLSSELAGLSANNTATASNNQLRFEVAQVDSSGIAIFNISESFLLTQNASLNLLPTTATVVINVTDNGDGTINLPSTLNFVGFLSDGSRVNQRNVLFNFHNTTFLRLGTQFEGSLLAPNANVIGNGVLQGSLIANSAIFDREIHFPLFEGNLPEDEVAEIPEPLSNLSLWVLVGLLLVSRATVKGRF